MKTLRHTGERRKIYDFSRPYVKIEVPIFFHRSISGITDVSSHRPYRSGLGIDKALTEIERGRGTAYDPAVVDACMRLFRERGYAIPA